MSKILRPGQNAATGSQTGESKPVDRTFTQEQVNRLMQKRVERSHNAFFNRYGVKDLAELDNLVGKSRSYDATLQLNNEWEQKFNDLTTQHADLVKKYAFKAGNINPQKYADIETYFKGKNLAIDENSLNAELKNHPDWINKVQTIQNLGPAPSPDSGVSEAELASQYFGVELH
jgi:hypothetical protein